MAYGTLQGSHPEAGSPDGWLPDTLENMQNDVRDIKHNVRDLMPDVRTLRNNYGAIHKEVNKMRCKRRTAMAIVCVSLNNLIWFYLMDHLLDH